MKKLFLQRLKSAVFGTIMGLCIPTLVLAQTATLLPNAKQQYFDAAGNPVAGGTVTYYVPGTTTKKTVWQDPYKATPQSNPVVLDSAGRPQPGGQTFGEGTYRQLVKSSTGTTIWDANTASTGSGGNTPVIPTNPTLGDGSPVGTEMAWASSVLPSTNWMFENGQAVSRTTYSVLMSALTITQQAICASGVTTITGLSDTTQIPIGAKVEATCVAPGSTVVSKTSTTVVLSVAATANLVTSATFFPFGNGDGATTFNLPDRRGVVMAGRPNMGGTDKGNLTSAYYGANPLGLGVNGGSESGTLITANLPPYTPAGTVAITDPGHDHRLFNSDVGTDQAGLTTNNYASYSGSYGIDQSYTVTGSGTNATLGKSQFNFTGVTAAFTGTAQGGTTSPFSRVQPTSTTNYIIKVLADYNQGYFFSGSVVAPVRLSTLTILPNAPTYSNGTAGVGATLTATSNGALSLDSVAVALNDRVLIRNQTDLSQNGIYTVTTLGTVSVPYVLTRATDFDTNTEMTANSTTLVTSGNTLTDTKWTLQSAVNVVGTDPVVFIQTSAGLASLFTTPHTWTATQTFAAPLITTSNFTAFTSNPTSSSITTKIQGFTTPLNLIGSQVDNVNDETTLLGIQHILNTNSHNKTTVFIETALNDAPAAARGYSGLQGVLQAGYPGNGSALYGLNYYCKLYYLATGWSNHTCGEITIEAQAGTSMTYKSAMQFVLGADDVEQGSIYDTIIAIGSTAGAPSTIKGAKNAILVGNMNGWQPLDTDDGCVVCTSGSATIKSFLDAKSYTVTDALLRGTGHITATASGTDVTGIASGDIGAARTTNRGRMWFGTNGGNYIEFDTSTFSFVGGSSVVNYLGIVGAGTGNAPVFMSLGSDSNIAMSLQSKGVGDIYLGSATQGTSFSVSTASTTVNRLGIGGTATTVAPTLSAIGNDLNINVNVVPKGTGRLQVATVNVPSISSTDTLTNKSMDGGSNTFTNIPGTAITGAALTKTDDTNVTLTLGGTPATALLRAASITVGWTGTLAASRGGTGLSSLGTGVPTALGINVGSAGAFVTFNGALGTPSSATLTNATGLPISGITGFGTGVATALAVNVGTAGAFVVNGGALGSPSSVGTLPAFTLGGTISGGGNQINNVVIGTSTPLAGSFTTLSASTSLTSPLHVGGSGTTGTRLELRTTSGNGTTDALIVTRGNNGATTALTVNANGLSLGSTALAIPAQQGDLTVARSANTGAAFFGYNGSQYIFYDGSKYLFQGGVPALTSATYLMRNTVSWTNNAAAAVGTLTNAPAAGNPTKWIAIDDNGTTRYIPAW